MTKENWRRSLVRAVCLVSDIFRVVSLGALVDLNIFGSF